MTRKLTQQQAVERQAKIIAARFMFANQVDDAHALRTYNSVMRTSPTNSHAPWRGDLWYPFEHFGTDMVQEALENARADIAERFSAVAS